MSWLWILIILFCVGGIALLARTPSGPAWDRTKFLRDLAAFLEGTLEPVTEGDYQNSFRIPFTFSNEKFVYEEFENQGFKDKVYQAFLKVKTPGRLTLTFTEKRRSTTIKTGIFMASDISSQNADTHVRLQAPKALQALEVFTNDPAGANEFFEDKKIITLLKQFKNVNSRGYPFLSIRIVDGEVILEFSAASSAKPSLNALRADMATIDNYLEKLVFIARKLKKLKPPR